VTKGTAWDVQTGWRIREKKTIDWKNWGGQGGGERGNADKRETPTVRRPGTSEAAKKQKWQGKNGLENKKKFGKGIKEWTNDEGTRGHRKKEKVGKIILRGKETNSI